MTRFTNEPDEAARSLLEAVAARRAARRTPHDDRIERVLAFVSIGGTVALALGILGQVWSLV